MDIFSPGRKIDQNVKENPVCLPDPSPAGGNH